MVDMTNDVARFETMFENRFTEKDSKFMELKSKALSNPVVIHPWKAQRKVWNKRWEYSSPRNRDNRGQTDRSSDRYQDRYRGGGYSRSSYRDRSNDRDRPRDRYDQDRDRPRERKYDFQSALKSYSER